jgi:tRNA C32,U32 (ribose-2'-O)-methylase TrmJ
VGIVLYEFSKFIERTAKVDSKTNQSDKIDKNIDKKNKSLRQGIVEIAQRSEKDRLFGYSNNAISKLYENDSKIYVVTDSMKKIIFKSLLTKREVFALMGFFKNVSRLAEKNIKKENNKKIRSDKK